MPEAMSEPGLLAADGHYRSIFNAMLNGLAYCKVLTDGPPPHDFVYLEVNEAFETLTGLTDVAGKKVSEVIPGLREQDPELLQIYGEVAATGRPRKFERYVEALKQWFSVSVYSPEKDYFVAVFDVTTKARATEQSLLESEEHSRELLQAVPLGVVYQDAEGRITSANPAAERILGLSLDQMQGRTSVHPQWMALREDGSELPGSEHPAMVALRTGREIATAVMGVFNPVLASHRWIRVSAVTRFDPTRNVVVGVFSVFEDITDRMRVEAEARAREAALQESEIRFRTLTTAAPVGVFQADTQGNNVFMNPAMERITGMSAPEARGKGWMESVHPEDREKVHQEWMAAIAAGRDFTSDYRFLAPSGKVCWVRGYGSAVQDPAGANTGYMAVVVDITEQRAMEQRLAVASRLAAMGTLVTGVAHEINNPMTGIVAGVGTAMGDIRASLEKVEQGERPSPEAWIERDREILEMLGEASEAAAKITRTVRDLSVFGAPSQGRTRLRTADIVSGALRWLPSSVHAVATVSVKDLGAPDVMASRGHLEQVLVNLVTNAAKATRPGTKGEILVRIGESSPGRSFVEVVDHGTGIEHASLGKIFDPFFTTRPSGDGRGTGLGLAICHAIETDHGGTITVESEVGKGSTFRVELPAASAEATSDDSK